MALYGKGNKKGKGEKMNKEYWEYYFSKKKKLTERAFKVRIAMLMTSMLACAAIMASSAFALFTCDIKRSTTLTAASFSIEHYGCKERGNSDDKTLVIKTRPEGVIGYCKVKLTTEKGDTYTYYTQAFSDQIELILTGAAGCEIIVSDPHWGYPQNFDIDDKLIKNGMVSVPKPESGTEADSASGGEIQSISSDAGTKIPENTPTADIVEDNLTEDKVQEKTPSVEQMEDKAEKKEENEASVTEKTTESTAENRLTEAPVAPPSEKGNATEKQKIESEPVQKTEAPVKVTEIKPATASGNNDAGSGNGDSSGSSSSDAPAPAVSSAGGESPSDGGGE